MVRNWAKINFYIPETKEQIYSQTLWYNSHIKVNNNIQFKPTWYDKGVIYVRDLWCKGKLMKHQEFKSIFQIECNVMEYNSLVDSIPGHWRKSLSESTKLNITTDEVALYYKLQDAEQWTKIVYDKLIERQDHLV